MTKTRRKNVQKRRTSKQSEFANRPQGKKEVEQQRKSIRTYNKKRLKEDADPTEIQVCSSQAIRIFVDSILHRNILEML